MTTEYAPFDSGAGVVVSVDFFTAMMRAAHTNGVARALTTDADKGSLGLEMAPFADSSGMQVKVRVGEMWVQGRYFRVTEQETLAIAAAPATSGHSRKDRVIVKLNESANTITLEIKAGTASASPSAPALVQSSPIWEISLATVTVTNGDTTVAAGAVADERSWSRPVGGAFAECRVVGAGGVDGSGNYLNVPDKINVDHVHNISTGLVSVHLKPGLRAVRAIAAVANNSLVVSQGSSANDATTVYLTFKTDAGVLTNPLDFHVAVFGDS